MFERKPLTKLVEKKQLSCFPHDGLWQCMDTLRDKEILEEMVKSHRFKYTK